MLAIQKSEPKPGTGLRDWRKEDLPWVKSQVCQARVKSGKVEELVHLPSYFSLTVSDIVNRHGIGTMQAWQDGLKHAKDAAAFSISRLAVNFWDTLYRGGFDTARDWSQKGYDLVISSPDYLYLDFPYEVSPLERGYHWGTRFNDERKIFGFAPDNLSQNAETSVDRDGNFFSAKAEKPWSGAYSISAQLWSEAVRTDAQTEHMIYPRLFAVAERSWHRAGWEQDYKASQEHAGAKPISSISRRA